MDTIYVATWTSEYGDERKAFANKEDAEREIRRWIGEYILDTLEEDGIEETKKFLETIVIRDDTIDNSVWYQVGKDKEQVFVDEIEFKA
jgi:hypothetical protein